MGRHLVLSGRRVYVEETGPASARSASARQASNAVVCLHGLGGGAHFFAALGAALQDRYRTIALDFPGAGFSPLLTDFSFDALADIVVDLVRATEAPALCVIGHSMGTIVAMEAFRRSPTLAHGFIAVGGLADPLPGARSRIAARAQEIRRAGLGGLGPAVAAANLSPRTLDDRPELAALLARLFELQSPEGYVATAETLATWGAREPPSFDRVTCLAVTGEHDVYAPPDAVSAFARTLPSGTEVQVVAGAAHLPFFEQPASFAAIVRRFLDDLR